MTSGRPIYCSRAARVAAVAAISFTFLYGVSGAASAQDRDRDGDRGRAARLDPGTVIPVRVGEPIDSHAADHRIYRAFVAQDVRGDRGRLVIPRGSPVELTVREMRDNDLRLDLESVTIDGQRYGLRTDPKHIEAHDSGVIGGVVGAISGGQAGGREVRVPRDAVLSFRLERPLDVGVQDDGYNRDGEHYHHDYRDGGGR